VHAVLLIVLVGSQAVVAPNGVLPAGTQLTARMNTTIGTRKALSVDRLADQTRAGAPFAATVEAPILDEGGRVRVPGGAIIHGHVAKLSRGLGPRRATIELAVDRFEGRPLQGRVVEAEVQQLHDSDTGAEVDTTAFWGALVGGLVAGVPGVAVGHAFGGGAGALSAGGDQETEGWVQAGSLITVELDEPLRVDRCVAARDDRGLC
jgi:hypothetical protein